MRDPTFSIEAINTVSLTAPSAVVRHGTVASLTKLLNIDPNTETETTASTCSDNLYTKDNTKAPQSKLEENKKPKTTYGQICSNRRKQQGLVRTQTKS